MSHYYKEDKNVEDAPFQIDFDLAGESFSLTSNNGVFSKDKLDTGTKILLETVLEKSEPCRSVLDLGCGIGTIGTVLGTFWHCRITGIDTNARAGLLAEENYRNAGVDGTVIVQDGLEGLDEKFDCILLNPPIRAGKEVIYRLFEQSLSHLSKDGALWIVMRKQHGAASAVSFLEEHGAAVSRENRDKGFWVLKAVPSENGQPDF